MLTVSLSCAKTGQDHHLSKVLVFWVALHCCLEHGSFWVMPLWTAYDDVYITTCSQIWVCGGIQKDTVKDCTHTLVSCFIWFPCNCFVLCMEVGVYFPPAAIILQQYILKMGCQIWSCPAAFSLLGLYYRMTWFLCDWLTEISVFHLYLALRYLLYNCVLLLFGVCLISDYNELL